MANCAGCPIIGSCKVRGHKHVGECRVKKEAMAQACKRRRKWR